MAPSRRSAHLFALLLTLLAATFLVAGCGGDDGTRDLTGDEFSDGNLADFSAQLDLVQQMVDEEDCDGAIQKVENLRDTAVDAISSDVDGGLKDDLKDLLGRLSTQIGEQCTEEVETTTTDESSTEETTTTTETDTTTTDTTTPPEDTTTTPPPDTGEGGGTEPTNPGGGQGGTNPGAGPTSPPDPGGPSGGITPKELR